MEPFPPKAICKPRPYAKIPKITLISVGNSSESPVPSVFRLRFRARVMHFLGAMCRAKRWCQIGLSGVRHGVVVLAVERDDLHPSLDLFMTDRGSPGSRIAGDTEYFASPHRFRDAWLFTGGIAGDCTANTSFLSFLPSSVPIRASSLLFFVPPVLLPPSPHSPMSYLGRAEGLFIKRANIQRFLLLPAAWRTFYWAAFDIQHNWWLILLRRIGDRMCARDVH